MMRLVLALLISAGANSARSDEAGEFDYYVLALSWSPNWCRLEGDAKGSPQCDEVHDFGWTLHGLWPQYERGWPDFCPTSERNPPRNLTANMADIMGTSGLAWYQWRKHGTCSGLSAENYYRLSRLAYEQVNRPEVFRKLPRTVELPAKVVEDAFLEANPKLLQNQITVTCRSGHIQEVRLCLTRDLTPRKCGYDVIRDCTSPNAVMEPIR